MVKVKKTVRFPILATLLLAGIFVLGSATGMFLYATGEEVITNAYMQMVSHTEYRYNEPGQIIARLVDYQGAPVVVDNCTATIKYPDKTAFVTTALMSTSTISGDHFYNFTTPNGPEGTYEYQAICSYTVGVNVRTQSVTNSFHLSSAFSSIIANQTAQNVQLTAIQGNVTAIKSELDIVAANVLSSNATLSAQLTGLSDQLNTNVSTLYTQANNNMATVQSQLNSNVSTILSAISGVTVNTTAITDALANLNSALAANFTYTNGLITTLQSNMNNNFTATFSYLSAINTTANNMQSVLLNINTTTTNTYQYVTGTLASNVGNILTDLGIINATVNRIETTTNAVNATVNTILQNQENAVQMTVFSG